MHAFQLVQSAADEAVLVCQFCDGGLGGVNLVGRRKHSVEQILDFGRQLDVQPRDVGVDVQKPAAQFAEQTGHFCRRSASCHEVCLK